MSAPTLRDLVAAQKALLDRPNEPKGPTSAAPVRGSAIPKAGKRYSGGTAPQGA